MKRHYWIELDDVIADQIADFGGTITFGTLEIEGLAQTIKDQRKVAPHLVIPPVIVDRVERKVLCDAAASSQWQKAFAVGDPLFRVFGRCARAMAYHAPATPFTPKKDDWILWRSPSEGGIWSGPGEVVLADDLRIVVAHSSGGDVLLSTDRLEFTLAPVADPEAES